MTGVARKWRPQLGLVMFVVLGTVLMLPLVGLLFFRVYENLLVRQTEAELIGQSAVFAAVVGREIETNLPLDVPFGLPVAPLTADEATGSYRAVLPVLDLATTELLPRRPEGRVPAAPSHRAFQALGARFSPDLLAAQQVTLAGFRLLDPDGVVIGGREEIGVSLAQVEEVAEALRGRFRSVLRRRVLTHESPPLYSLSRGTELRVFVAMPIIARDHVAGVVYASRTPSNVFKEIYQERGKFAVAGVSIVLVTLLVGLLFYRTIIGPVRDLIVRTVAIEKGDPAALRSLTHYGTAEFAALGRSLLDMATSLTRRSDFLSAFVAHVSHELKSPLTAIRGAAELLDDDVGATGGAMTDDQRRQFLRNILAESDRLTVLVRRLRELARAEALPIVGTTGLAAVIPQLRAAFPRLVIEADGDLETEMRLSRENALIIFSHLADNAVRHGATGFRIEVARRADDLRLTMRDDGGGVSPNNRSRIFDAFFTTRRESGGTGMGLTLVRTMLGAHGGSIELLDGDQGAAFVVMIPVVRI